MNWDFIHMKNFCSSKHTVKRMKTQVTDWDKIFAKHISDEGIVSWVHKEHSKFTVSKQITHLKKGQKVWIRHFTKEDRWKIDPWRKCSKCLIIREMQVKIKVNYKELPLHTTRMAIMSFFRHNNKCWGCRETGTFIHCFWEWKSTLPLWKNNFAVS